MKRFGNKGLRCEHSTKEAALKSLGRTDTGHRTGTYMKRFGNRSFEMWALRKSLGRL